MLRPSGPVHRDAPTPPEAVCADDDGDSDEARALPLRSAAQMLPIDPHAAPTSSEFSSPFGELCEPPLCRQFFLYLHLTC